MANFSNITLITYKPLKLDESLDKTMVPWYPNAFSVFRQYNEFGLIFPSKFPFSANFLTYIKMSFLQQPIKNMFESAKNWVKCAIVVKIYLDKYKFIVQSWLPTIHLNMIQSITICKYLHRSRVVQVQSTDDWIVKFWISRGSCHLGKLCN